MVLKADRLWDIYGLSNHQYCVTITPKGNDITHQKLLKDFFEEISKLKCLISFWLVAEDTTTNHYHGMIQTTIECKFSALCHKASPVRVWIEEYAPYFNKRWQQYCVKNDPETYLYYNKLIMTL